MLKSWQDKLIQQMMGVLTVDDLVQSLDAYLPELTAHWSKEERARLLHHLLTHHLDTLLADFTAEEKQELLRTILPALLKTFPLDDFDMTTLFR